MRWNTKLLVSLLFFTVSISFAAPLELIVKYKETTGKQVKSSNAQIKSSRLVARVEGFVEKYKNTKLFKDNYIVRASSSENYLELLEQLQNDPNVEYVHPNYVYHKQNIPPNDVNYNSKQKVIMDKYQMEDAWDISTGSAGIIVAVVDTGIDLNHPDLTTNIVAGYNFVTPGLTPDDDEGHGTHVAGIIGAIGNNLIGITGMCWKVSLMPIKVIDSSSVGYFSDIVAGIEYAYTHGAKVINLSLGGTYSTYFQKVIDSAYDAGAIIVVSAGNGNMDISRAKASPICNDGDANKVIGVSALNSNKTKASFSNYSDKYVDVSAFGVNIYSTVTNNVHASMSGTSMSAPAVSGIIALLLSLDPTLTPAQVVGYLKSSAENIDAVNPAYAGKLGAGLIKADNLLNLYLSTITSNQTTEQILQYYNYPNPADSAVLNNSYTTFFAEFTKPVSHANLSIYSLTGRKVYAQDILQVANTFLYHPWDLSSHGVVLPPGPYIAILKANVGGSEITKYHKVLLK